MTTSRKAIVEGALLLRGILGGLFPVLTVIAYKNSLSPLTTLAWSYLIATIFFIILLTVRKEWGENVRNIKALKDVFLAVFIIAIVVHLLLFLSLKFTSAQNYSLLGLMEIVFSFIIIGWISKKEPISKNHIYGSSLMLLSAGIILFGGVTKFNIGDILILVATIIAPIGNIFAKRALHQISLAYLLFLRSLSGVIIFFIISNIFEEPASSSLLIASMPYLLFSGVVFFGIMKIIMMFGFKQTSVTHAISFQSLKPVFAFIFAWILLKEAPTAIQIAAIFPCFLGLYLITRAKQKKTQYGFEKIA